uniref:Amino acid permease/ SLC12A domain-containing protein n=1 Tax=Ditylenchus dipsaci TaxID=166011 RepID=A0A915DW95_9BILA
MSSSTVLITISVVFLISALFTVTSTTVVALLHNIAHLRVNYLDVPESFDELFNSCCFFLLGFLAIESLSFLADETEQPGKVIRQFLSVQISFTEDTVLPVVFNSISIFSARYLMNVGSICGLASAVLCAYLPTTRIVCALAEDRLLPFQSSKCKLNRLHGKGGSPRLAVLTTVFIVCLLVVLVPKPLMVQLIPLNLCFRLFSLAFLVFKSNFASEKSSQFVTQSLPAKYNRMRHCGVSSMTNSNSAASSSDVEDGRSEFSSNGDIDDEGMRLFEQMCQLTNLTNCHDCNYGAIGEPTESSGLLVPPSGISNNNMPQHYCATSQNRHLPRVHNCLTSPCASSLQISAACGPSTHRPTSTFTTPKVRFGPSSVSGIIVQIFRLKTEDDYGFAANNVSSTPPEETRKRSRWQSVGCLLSMFLLIQLLFQFPLIKYMLVVGWICLGFVMYSISVCKKKV